MGGGGRMFSDAGPATIPPSHETEPYAMKLDVLKDEAAEAPWYAEGLKFTCTQCGNCCTGGPGFVWISREEIRRLAEFLKITPQETVEKYCRKVDGRWSLKEFR